MPESIYHAWVFWKKKQNAQRKEHVFLSKGSEIIIQLFAGEYHLKFSHFHGSMSSIIYGFAVQAPLKGARSFCSAKVES